MPCFKGIAVSVHAEGAPLPEYSLQKQTRMSRIGTYIPVPKPKVKQDSLKPEPAKFAISITLLTPGLAVPYSTPKSSPTDPHPRPQIVGNLPGSSSQQGSSSGAVGPYIPITKSENETIAAYIYFDGRAKEEVATLLRPGDETWVNSRWVQVPDSEGGGLAEREFLFREVGLERWLNGLDLDGHDAAAKMEKRREKMQKRRRRRKQESNSDDDLADLMAPRKVSGQSKVLRYGADEHSPVEKLSDDEDDFSFDSDDDDAPPEAAGQIKVCMFRVLASGEIKRGEYSPQFDAHDDDEEGKNGGNGDGEEVDHTTSFAKPKTLDPKSISTQTVTGIDGPDKPFATFTFFYRGERQLQKMGIHPKNSKSTASATSKHSRQVEFPTGPLKSTGTVGFSAYRTNDIQSGGPKARKRSNGDAGAVAGAMDEDSEEDDEDPGFVGGRMEDTDDKDDKDPNKYLSAEDAKFQGELADGVGRIKLKRQHSAEPMSSNSRKSPGSLGSTSLGETPPPDTEGSAPKATLSSNVFGSASLPEDSSVGSPMKKHRASLYDVDNDTIQNRLMGFGNGIGTNVVAAAEAAHTPLPEPAMKDAGEEEEEL